jgi:hypothetical protein
VLAEPPWSRGPTGDYPRIGRPAFTDPAGLELVLGRSKACYYPRGKLPISRHNARDGRPPPGQERRSFYR